MNVMMPKQKSHNKIVLTSLIMLMACGFSYDANGNQTLSPNGLTITYNSINQPQQVKSGSTVKHKFAYLADGRKLHSISDPANDGGLAYIGTSVFNIGRGNYTSFESTSFSAGRIVRSVNGTYTVQYHITDHLGSVRAVLNQSMTVLEQNDYYPFGLRHPNASLKTTANRYRYNGKEEIAADATSDYGARQYSAEFCQWMQVDPLAEKYYSWSPYNFCVGNPLRFVDPDGCEFTENAWEWVNKLIANIDSRQARNNSKIADKQALINNGGLSDRRVAKYQRQIHKLNNANSKLEEVRGEIATLAASDQVYNVNQISYSSSTTTDAIGNSTVTASTSFNDKTKAVDINISSNAGLGLFAHELKHAYQFETGAFSIGPKVSGIYHNFLYDKYDEVEAHNRGALFGGISYSINSLPTIYNDITTGPVDATIHPTIIRILNTPIDAQKKALQKIANQSGHAFRINGTTYYKH